MTQEEEKIIRENKVALGHNQFQVYKIKDSESPTTSYHEIAQSKF